MSIDPYKSPYNYSFDDYLEDDFFKKEKPIQIHRPKWDSKDGILDEEFEKAERFAKLSPLVKKKGPDDVEKITLQFFAHLYELANRTGSEDAAEWDAIFEGHSPSPKRHTFSKSYAFNQYESNFSDDFSLDTIQSNNSLQDLLNAVSEIFLGTRFDNAQTRKSSLEMKDILMTDQATWKSLRTNYSDYFQAKMDQVFSIARELIRGRMQEEETADQNRIAFYACSIITAFGLLINQKIILAAGTFLTLAMSSYMIVNYATSSLDRMQQESSLKLSIDNIYYEASKHRRTIVPGVSEFGEIMGD